MAVAWLSPGGRVQLDGEHGGRAAAMALLLFFVDADAALLRDGGGVDAVHIFRALQQAFDGGVADEIGFGVGECAAVGEIDGLDAAFAGLREKRAEAAGEVDVGRELDVLLVAERRQVDGILHDAELEIFADLHARSGCRRPPALRR